MKNTKKEVPTVNETVDTSKETKTISNETLPNLMKEAEKQIDPSLKLN